MGFLQSIGSKIVTAVLAIVVIAAGISWFRMSDEDQRALLSGAGRLGAWAGAVAVLPWVTIFVIRAVAKRESNLAGGLLVAGYTIVEIVALLWLFHFSIHGAAMWLAMIFASLIAALYNLLACDWIAEQFE